ncbi:hypothetical protein [Phaeovulum sp. NW3]|nr:hypothetical protein [Phaeovulum sp. NW3]
MTPAVHWQASRDGLAIYRGDELVAAIPFSALGRLLYDLAAVMRG